MCITLSILLILLFKIFNSDLYCMARFDLDSQETFLEFFDII